MTQKMQEERTISLPERFYKNGAANMEYSSIGENWEDFEKRLFTPEELAESDLRVALLSACMKHGSKKAALRKSWKN